MSTHIAKPQGPAEIPGQESTHALALVPTSSAVHVPEPIGLPIRIAEAYTRAITEVEYLLDSPEVHRRFAYLLLTELRTKPALQACTPDSLVTAIVEMAEENLDPSGMNECFLVAYQGEAKMQRGYAGLIKLACSHPEVADIFADEVCVNDTYEFYGVNSRPKHIYPGGFQPRGRYLGYYAVAQLTSARWRAVQMSVEEIKDHAKQYSQSAGKKVWSEDRGGGFRGMALKTVIRKLCNPKFIPMAASVCAKLQQQDVVEGVIVESPLVDARLPLAVREAAKTRDEHIEDLTGRPPTQDASPRTQPPAGTRGGTYVAQLEALLVTHGGDIPAFWQWAERQKKKAQALFTEADYADLLQRAQTQAKKKTAAQDATNVHETHEDMARLASGAAIDPQDAERPTDDPGATHEASPSDTPGAWREMLAGLLPSLDDATLAQEAQSVLEDADVNDEAGNAMVMRVLGQLEAQDEQAGLPF